MPQIWVHFLLKTTLLLALLPVASCAQSTSRADVVEFESVRISYEPLQGICLKTGMLRRDPSDVINYPEGFNGTIWFATSTDGVRWIEHEQALGRGKEHKFHAFGAFTSNILYAPTTNKYYSYFTGVRVEDGKRWDFQRISGSIGVAVADSPDGEMNGWYTDDTVMFYRDQKYWLYYKGHSQARQLPGSKLPEGATPMGLAVSNRPDGGFERVPHTPASSFLVQPGHELLLWPYHDGILSLPTGHYRPAHRGDFRLHYSPDGLNFMAVSPVIQTAQQGPNAGLQRFTQKLNKVKSKAGFDGDQ